MENTRKGLDVLEKTSFSSEAEDIFKDELENGEYATLRPYYQKLSHLVSCLDGVRPLATSRNELLLFGLPLFRPFALVALIFSPPFSFSTLSSHVLIHCKLSYHFLFLFLTPEILKNL